jgi:polysaccharide biosynthesis/export protein
MNLRLLCLNLGLSVLATCLPLRAAAPAEPVGNADNNRESAPKGDYVLQQQDLIRVKVFQEEDLSLEVRVSQELTVTLPLIGTMDLRGKTVRQAEELITQHYGKDYLVNPQVNVIVVEYWKRFVKVFGSVNTPGVIVFPPEEGLTLLGAISRAGGFSRLADKKKVILTRVAPDGNAETKTYDAEGLLSKGIGEDVPLQPEDVINVGERIL